jgi:nitrogen fixation protein FixH
MKINWGTGVVIAFGVFMSFILFFVFSVQSNHKYDNELVVTEYYKKEAQAQQNIDEEQNAHDLKNKVAIQSVAEGITIDFPADFDYKTIQGTVSLYRPSNQKLDFEVPISLSSPHLLIPKSNLVGGRWGITIDWNYQGKKYLNKEEVYFNQ